METLRNTSYPSIASHNEKMCELNKISEQGWKKTEDSRTGTEYSRIITDPNTGKCYCRGKVLGKVKGLLLLHITIITYDKHMQYYINYAYPYIMHNIRQCM